MVWEVLEYGALEGMCESVRCKALPKRDCEERREASLLLYHSSSFLLRATLIMEPSLSSFIIYILGGRVHISFHPNGSLVSLMGL
jgi:hypothetical protein